MTTRINKKCARCAQLLVGIIIASQAMYFCKNCDLTDHPHQPHTHEESKEMNFGDQIASISASGSISTNITGGLGHIKRL